MKLTSEQIAALREFGDWAEQVAEKLARGETVALEREVKRWEPEGGVFFVGGAGRVRELDSTENFRLNGVERTSFQAAQRLANDQRIFNRLHAYREEFAPGYVVPHCSSCAWFILKTEEGWMALQDVTVRVPTTVYMPESVAKDLCRKLNSGEVVL